MHDMRLRAEVRRLAATGRSPAQIARDLELPHTTVHRWATRRTPTDSLAKCFACEPREPPPEVAWLYAYALGQYLGDGHLVTTTRSTVLRIYACADYPAITDEVVAAISCVRGRAPALMRVASSDRVTKIESYRSHWRCLLPQHGPGMKHTRMIMLAGWQQQIVADQPWPLIRGLIHSDGCRSINRVVVRGKAYEYPRYFFSNRSRDILGILGEALDRVGVAWRYNLPISISIAKRDAVALMDEHVEPKS
jgi:hypothetical protein